MKLLAVCIANAQPTPGRKSSRTGIFKEPVQGAVMVDSEGLLGDRIINRKYHGGPDQAVYIEGSVDREWWESELGIALAPGSFGENLLIEELDNRAVSVGDQFGIGDVLLEITSARIPCSTFAAKMGDPKFVKRYMQAGRPGAYARILRDGTLTAGADVIYTPFAGDRLTMPELMRTYGKRLDGNEMSRYLALPISSRMRQALSSFIV